MCSEVREIKLFVLLAYCWLVNGLDRKILITVLSSRLLLRSFTLVGSRTFIFGGDYELFVTRGPQGQPMSSDVLILELEGKTTTDTLDKKITLNFDKKLIKFNVSFHILKYIIMTISIDHLFLQLREHHTVENFTLTATIKSTGYKQSVDVFTINKKCSVLIQTDKPRYKPGDKFQFRVLTLDAETKPYLFDQLSVNITDSNGNVVYEESSETLKIPASGIFAGDYEISDSPPLGTWSVVVRVDKSDLVSQSFEVAEFVLPRFCARINGDSHVLLSARKLKVQVFGEYTFGEFVSANVEVTAKVVDQNDYNLVKTTSVKQAHASAKKYVEFDMQRDLKLSSSGVVMIDVVIEEKLTGKKANDSKIIFVHEKEEHRIELITNELKIKPGFPFTVHAVVTKFDETPETTSNHTIKFDVFYQFKRKSTAERLKLKRNQTIRSDLTVTAALKNGVADLKIDLPENVIEVEVTAKFLDATATLKKSADVGGKFLRTKISDET